eukprot:s109_g6.t1
MGPFSIALQWTLLCSSAALRAALRDGPNVENLQLDEPSPLIAMRSGDECEEEAKHLQQLMWSLAFKGPMTLDHCNLEGISCDARCRVEKIRCATCTGHLPDYIHLKNLQEVILTSPNLTGDIKAFAGTAYLKTLDLHGTRVTGDLQVFQNMTSLVALRLYNTEIFGDLKGLAASMWLQYLSLGGTKIHGDLNAIKEMSRLMRLNLRNTRISGDLAAFDNTGNPAAILEILDLTNTDVTGQLSDLPGYLTGYHSVSHSNLKRLKLGGTKVTGNLAAITQLTRIQEVDLSSTRVVGQLTTDWRGSCPRLHTLQLQKSSIQFAPVGKHFDDLTFYSTQISRDILPNLRYLDLTDCPVNSPVENLLLPLAMCVHLTFLTAGDAGLFGAMPRLQKAMAIVDDQRHDDFTFPMSRRLLLLELSYNNVSWLTDLPVRPKAGRVLLRENHQIKLAPGVLAQALKQRVMLDLSGTQVRNKEEALQLLEEGQLTTTDMYAYRDETAGYTCKDLVSTIIQVTPNMFLPEKLCTCLPGWHGHGATCHMCPADKFSDEMGLDTCKLCPPNSTAPEGSTKLTDCKCKFGDLHNGTCSCDKHQTLRDGNCILCSKVHLQCETAGIRASGALPDVHHARLDPKAEEARRCLPPDTSQRCPGSHQCGLGYSGTLCTRCADGFWAKQGRCKPCSKASSTRVWFLALLGVVALLVAAVLIYRHYRHAHGHSVSQRASVKSLLQKRMLIQAPILLQMVQLWTVLSSLGQRNGARERLPELSYLEALQLTIDDVQTSLNGQCKLDGETVRTLAALGSPLLPLFLLLCCAVLELSRPGLGVNMALKTLTVLFIGGAFSTAELLSCQFQDGDGESLGDFAFRTALPQLRCYDRSGIGFWVDVAGYSSALAYGILIPLFLAGLMVRQYIALQEARLFCAYAEGEPEDITLRLQTLQGELPKEASPKRLLAAVAAYMAVHCRGKRMVRLHDGSITTTSTENDGGEVRELSVIKVVANAEASRNIDALTTRRLTEMLTERIMLDEAEDRFLIGFRSLLCKYTLCQDVWMFVATKLFALALISCVSMTDAWKWPIAFSLGMAVLVGVCQPYMHPQVSQLQTFSYFCLALTSVAFIYDWPWLARVALMAPLTLLFWQVREPDCTAALAERLYQELQSELPKLQRGEAHEVIVQKLRLGSQAEANQ